jgi:hypothetical protein
MTLDPNLHPKKWYPQTERRERQDKDNDKRMSVLDELDRIDKKASLVLWLACLVLSLVLYYMSYHIVFCTLLSCLVVSCRALSCLGLAWLGLACPGLAWLIVLSLFFWSCYPKVSGLFHDVVLGPLELIVMPFAVMFNPPGLALALALALSLALALARSRSRSRSLFRSRS